MASSVQLLCENCDGPHDGSFASGRFCSRVCSNSFVSKMNREEKNKKTSKTLSNREGRTLSPETRMKISEGKRRYHEAQSKVKFHTIRGVVLNITRSEINEYRKLNEVCEICGKKDGVLSRKLAVDHCHETLKFRGLLCTKCNMNYDWFLKNKDGILKYTNKKQL